MRKEERTNARAGSAEVPGEEGLPGRANVRLRWKGLKVIGRALADGKIGFRNWRFALTHADT